MHEFSLAQNIVEIVDKAIKEEQSVRVCELVLEIGTISGIEISALETALKCLQPSSILKDANIKLEVVQAKARCRQCDHPFIPEELLSPCPKCQNFGFEILAGKELLVKSITAE